MISGRQNHVRVRRSWYVCSNVMVEKRRVKMIAAGMEGWYW